MNILPRYRSLIRVSAIVLALSLGIHPPSRAEPPVLIWGFQRACDRLKDVDRSVEKALQGGPRTAALLQTPTGQPLPACSGERCAQAFAAACPNAKGRILGGQAIQGKIVRTRLWLYDLSTSQIAYQDDYCHTCLVSGALIEHSRALIEHPQFGPSPGPIPLYCAALPSGPNAAYAKGPVFLSVYGDGKHKTALYATLRAQLESLGRTVMPVPGEPRSHSTEELDQIVAGQQNARVLSVLVQKEGTVTVQLYDQKSRVTDAEEVSCPACGAEALSLRVKESVAGLLDRCAGSRCAEAVMAGAVQAPVGACDPFPGDSCASAGLESMLSPVTVMASGGGLDSRTARLIKGLSWGGFATSAATGITLFALSGTSVADYKTGVGHTVENSLDVGAWTATSIAAVLLGLSIPLTVVVDRAGGRVAQPTSQPNGPAFIQCPN